MPKSKIIQRPASSWDKLPAVIDAQCVAIMLGLSVQSVRRMACKGEIPAQKVGKRIWRFSKEDVMNAVKGGSV